jgi:hypothetical protein
LRIYAKTARIPNVAGYSLVHYVLTVVGLTAIAAVPLVIGVPAVALLTAVAGDAVAGVPAVAFLHAVAFLFAVSVVAVTGVPAVADILFLLRNPCTAKTKYRNFETNIPRKGIARTQSPFPHSCVCERLIYSHNRSAFSAGGNM